MILVSFLIWIAIKIVDSGARISTVTDGTLSLAQPTSIDGARMPHFLNGTEYGISMWIYLAEPPRTTERSPLLSIGGAPIFELAHGRSDIAVNFPVYNPPNKAGVAAPPQSADHGVFDHVSLRRWVHLMAVHRDGTVTLFKDGELASVNRLQNVDVTNPGGTVRVGGRPVDGFIASVVFLNHFPSNRQVKRLYRAGPAKTNWVFRLMGFDNLGVRSPIYRITD